ncbi:MAG: hypothetical protein U1D30_21625 [Planctomycetota bacterium]
MSIKISGLETFRNFLALDKVTSKFLSGELVALLALGIGEDDASVRIIAGLEFSGRRLGALPRRERDRSGR